MKHKNHNPTLRREESRAAFIAALTNLFLALVKLLAGLLCSAPTLIADAIHSGSDLVSTAVVAVGIRLARKPPDREHPYGHDRLESIASLLLSGILLAAGIGIGYDALSDIVTRAYLEAAPPMAAAILVAGLSVGTKLLLARYMSRVAAKAHSTALRADSLHQLSDALASLFALVGIVLSIFGLRVFDPIASVFIALFLVRAALSIFLEASRGLSDRSVDKETEEALRLAIESVDGITVTSVRTRLFGAGIYLEVGLLPDLSRTVLSYEKTVRLLEERVRAADPRVKGCTVSFFPK